MQNFDDFENFSKNQNLKEVFQHVFNLDQEVDKIRESKDRPLSQIFDYDEAARSVAGSAEEFGEDTPLEEIHEAGDAPAFYRETPQPPKPQPPKPEPPKPIPPKPEPIRQPAPRPEPPKPIPPKPQPPKPEPPKPVPPKPEPPRPQPPKPVPPVCRCPYTPKELKEFYFRIQELYFVLERHVDCGYERERMRGLRELCVKLLCLVKAKYSECFEEQLCGHSEGCAGDLRWAKNRTGELQYECLCFLERCPEPDREMTLAFMILQTIYGQIPCR